MKIGILTSSRADFGIYLPLLKLLFQDSFFQPEIIAFGTHLSEKYGFSVKEIEKNGYSVAHKLYTEPEDDSPSSIAATIGKTTAEFAAFWDQNTYDLVFALGDRYEMMAAVLAGSPFNIVFAHLHAGETTLGAIDDAYRHSISLMSKLLFTSTEEYRRKAISITSRPPDVHNVGALSIDNLMNEKLFTIGEFSELYSIDLRVPTILCTFHPETVEYNQNKKYIEELIAALEVLKARYQIIVTMPNSDTEGLMIREKLIEFANHHEEIRLIESFGMKGYLSCMKHCSMLIGNSSSAFVEASFFPRWVINLGNRQKGRILTPNILSVDTVRADILEAVSRIESLRDIPGNCNIYGNGDASEKIIKIIKEHASKNL